MKYNEKFLFPIKQIVCDMTEGKQIDQKSGLQQCHTHNSLSVSKKRKGRPLEEFCVASKSFQTERSQMACQQTERNQEPSLKL
jgi:hypothetical protein